MSPRKPQPKPEPTPPNPPRRQVFAVRLAPTGADRVMQRVHAENGGDKSAWLRRAISYAVNHMPEDYA